ncbi:MAG: hypothetical protein KTR24_03005 [Saprospiraceae bacterium]|nr:hypothetical protein [Saprospiraceae bacterium]
MLLTLILSLRWWLIRHQPVLRGPRKQRYAETYSIGKVGVAFGSYKIRFQPSDVQNAMNLIGQSFDVVRVYGDMGSMASFAALMESAESHGIDVILGVPYEWMEVGRAQEFVDRYAFDDSGRPWSRLKCIIVGNESYNTKNGAYKKAAPKLAQAVDEFIGAVASHRELIDRVAVSIDFGPAVYQSWNPKKCDFTGLSGELNPSFIVEAMRCILEDSRLNTPRMVFANLYPFYAPHFTGALRTASKMIRQFAGYDSGYHPYTACIHALRKYDLGDLILNIGETGWPTNGNNKGKMACQKTSVDHLSTYLRAFNKYLNNPSDFKRVYEFRGTTVIYFEMFDEPAKGSSTMPWEGHWGMYTLLEPGGAHNLPQLKKGLDLPHFCERQESAT